MKCQSSTASGKPCGAQALKGARFCFVHAPEMGAKRARARRKGGQASRNPHGGNPATIPHDINTLQDAKSILAYALREILPMQNTLQRARVLIALFDSFIKSLEVGELETRIAALEALAKK